MLVRVLLRILRSRSHPLMPRVALVVLALALVEVAAPLPVALELVAALRDPGVVRDRPADRLPLEPSRRGIEYTGLAVREERDGADEDPRHEAQLRALGHLLEAVEDLDLVREGEPGERGQERAARRGGGHGDR